MIHLDNNATTRPLPEVVEAVRFALQEVWANPSSVHRAGQAARREVERARQDVAALVGAAPGAVVWMSGATESVDLALRGVLAARPPQRQAIVTTPIEHEAVREVAAALGRAGYDVRHLDVDRDGRVELDARDAALAADDVGLVSVQWANNETGVVQPVAAMGSRCRERGVPFHTAATQAVGKIPVDLASTPVDLLSCAAHKLHGPKGVGALVIRPGVRLRPVVGGAQEQGRRGGTENVPGILGFGAAARAAQAWLADPAERERLAALRDRLERGLAAAIEDLAVNGGGERLWNTTNVGIPRLEAEALLLLLSERGLCASAGAACSSGSLDPSPVLLAMHVPEAIAHGSIRLSLSRETTADEIDQALEIIPACVERLRRSSAALGHAG